ANVVRLAIERVLREEELGDRDRVVELIAISRRERCGERRLGLGGAARRGRSFALRPGGRVRDARGRGRRSVRLGRRARGGATAAPGGALAACTPFCVAARRAVPTQRAPRSRSVVGP